MRENLVRFLSRREAPWIMVGLGLALRLATFFTPANAPLYGDALDYFHTAQQLLKGEAFEPDWPPGLPFYLSGVMALLGDQEWIAKIAMLPLYLICSLAVYGLILRFSDRCAASIALLALAVMPTFILVSVMPLTQLPTALLLAVLVLLVESCLLKPSMGAAFGIGLSLAGLLLVRPSNLLLCLLIPLWLFWRTKRWMVAVLPGALVLTFLSMWTYRAHELTGRLIFINNANSQNLFYGNNPWTPLYRTWWFGSHKKVSEGVPEEFIAEHRRIKSLPQADRDRAFSHAALSHVAERPDLFLVRTFARVRTFLVFDTFTAAQFAKRGESPWPAAALLALDACMYLNILFGAILLGLGSIDRGRGRILIGVSFAYAFPYFLLFSHPTYHVPLLPLWAVLSSAAASEWLQHRLKLKPSRVLGAVLLFAVLIQAEWLLDLGSRF